LRGTVPSRSEFKRCVIAKSIFVSFLVIFRQLSLIEHRYRDSTIKLLRVRVKWEIQLLTRVIRRNTGYICGFIWHSLSMFPKTKFTKGCPLEGKLKGLSYVVLGSRRIIRC